MKRYDQAMSQIQTIMGLSIVMIILFLLGIVLVIWNPIPELIPKATLSIEAQGDQIIMHHLGGDALSSDRIIVRVNGDIVNNQNLNFMNGAWPWSDGENVQFFYPAPESPRVVEVSYMTNKGESILLDKARMEPPPKVSATPMPVTVVLTTTPTPTPIVIPVEMRDLDPTIPPIADYTADPLVGDPPLTVSFRDLSKGKINSWLWSFGDGTTSTLQSPVHTYFVPGSYTVSLLVTNVYGSNRRTYEGFITIGSPPVANYLAEPIEGQSPLTVQFTDLSTGSPTQYEWSFSDGASSTDKDPVHIFQHGGNYSVILTVTNSYGINKYSSEKPIRVTSPSNRSVYLTNSVGGHLEPDGYIRFRVTSPVSSMKISGKIVNFVPGDIVQLIFGSESGDGTISSDKNQFVAFNFNDITLINNEEVIARGPVNDLKIGSFDSFSSTLNLTIPAGDLYDKLYIDQEEYKYVKTPKMRLIGIGPYDGKFFYQKSSRAMNFQGGITELQPY
ncbi:MAG TPA: PKD domain-containing protein [Methanospirillum sp.]|nr:PKD domain-containing protein [Methanospirillum sp.]